MQVTGRKSGEFSSKSANSPPCASSLPRATLKLRNGHANPRIDYNPQASETGWDGDGRTPQQRDNTLPSSLPPTHKRHATRALWPAMDPTDIFTGLEHRVVPEIADGRGSTPPARVRVEWSPHEVTALAEGVARFGKGRWAMILSQYAHRFDPKRTPVHLKVCEVDCCGRRME